MAFQASWTSPQLARLDYLSLEWKLRGTCTFIEFLTGFYEKGSGSFEKGYSWQQPRKVINGGNKMGEKIYRNNIKPKVWEIKIFFVSISRLNKVIAIKFAGKPERQAGLSDPGSTLPCLTTWVGCVLVSPEIIFTYVFWYVRKVIPFLHVKICDIIYLD